MQLYHLAPIQGLPNISLLMRKALHSMCRGVYLAVDGISQSVDDAAQQLHADWYVDNGSSSLDNVTFLDQLVITEHDNTDVVRLQVQRHALQPSQTELNDMNSYQLVTYMHPH